MGEYPAIEIRGYYRAESHLPVWEILQEAGIWREVGITLTSFEYCDDSSLSEGALRDGSIDFISGNHITPYTRFAEGFPIVHLASPSNAVNDRLVSRERIADLAELRGCSLGETALSGPEGGYAHNRGNHMLYLNRAGLEMLEDTEVVELAPKMSEEFRQRQLAALQDGQIDATFVTGSTAKFEQAGFHALELEQLPMINGPTLTTTTTRLQRDDQLGERLVKALLMGIRYASTHREETDRILAALGERLGEPGAYTAARVARMPRKPYPAWAAVGNAWELACRQRPETRQTSPLAVWDLHYLRHLDDSGWIDQL